jgi:hypothetical protein
MNNDFPTTERRCIQIFIENRTWGDKIMMFRLAELLRQYADMIDHGEAAHKATEVMRTEDGFEMTVMASVWDGEVLFDKNYSPSSLCTNDDQDILLENDPID